MRVSSLEVQDIFTLFGPSYENRYGSKMMPSQRKCLQDLTQCMTPALGGERHYCNDCEKSFWSYHGCGNRSCPKCHGSKTAQWLEVRKSEMLPCNYFHVVVTVPSELRPFALRHQKIIYGLLMKIAAECVLELAKDNRYVGAEVGILSVLHTWRGDLHNHPHVHMLVTGGGVEEGGLTWRSASKNYLFCVKALSKMIRSRFSKVLKKTHPEIHKEIPSKTWWREWCSFCKPSGEGTDAVLEYLARYVFRIAISNARIELSGFAAGSS